MKEELIRTIADITELTESLLNFAVWYWSLAMTDIKDGFIY
jgi:hypothetical protein